MTFDLNLVGLCLGFCFPSASSASLAWILSLGFPAILQTPFDLGCGISLLDFSVWSNISLLPQLPPVSYSREAADLLPSACLSCFRLLKKTFFPAAPPPTKYHPSTPGLEGKLCFLWNGAGEGLLPLCCWPFLSARPLCSTPESCCGIVQQLAQSSRVLFLSVFQWEIGDLEN